MENNSTSTEYEYITHTRKQPVWAFGLLCFFTFGLYTIYWSYRNWRFIKEHDERDIHPVWRSLFIFFFAHALLERIDDFAVEKGHPGISSNTYATGFVVLLLIQRILDRALPDQFVMLTLLLIPFAFLIPSVKQLNYIANSTDPDVYRPAFSAGEVVVLLLGAMITLLAVLGLIIA